MYFNTIAFTAFKIFPKFFLSYFSLSQCLSVLTLSLKVFSWDFQTSHQARLASVVIFEGILPAKVLYII